MDDLLSGGDDLPTQIDPSKDYLPELVGEGKKFKTPQDLARGKYEADLMIETFKRQQDQLRADYLELQKESAARARLEDLIDKLGQKAPASNEQPPVNVDNTPKFKPEELDSLIDSKMEARDANRRRQDNYKTVEAKLRETYGDTYPRVLKEQVAELGLTSEYINDLARTSPEAFFRTIGLNAPKTQDGFQPPVRSNQRSDNFAQKGNQKRTWTYYQELKKANPQLYYDPKITNQMQKDYAALGQAFEDGDFKSYGDGL